MPYAERVAEAYIQAKDNPAKQEQLVREGQFATAPGTPVLGPKYRQPTQDEINKTMSTMDGLVGGIGTFASGLGPIPAGIAALGLGGYFINRPDIEKSVRSQESEPVYENWEEHDYQNHYRNWG
ncbi:MAG: hypothetical protein ACLGSA_08480 [Acidobacteriota bacterium]